MTAPGTNPLTVRWTTSTLAVNVTLVVVTDPPFPYGWVAVARSTDKAVMLNASLARANRRIAFQLAASLTMCASVSRTRASRPKTRGSVCGSFNKE